MARRESAGTRGLSDSKTYSLKHWFSQLSNIKDVRYITGSAYYICIKASKKSITKYLLATDHPPPPPATQGEIKKDMYQHLVIFVISFNPDMHPVM